jgi:PIN domain nuclease of toxin-antitoxin system
VADLPRHHRDPFDRPLVAQCQAERLHLLTADRRFQPYEIDIIWAE